MVYYVAEAAKVLIFPGFLFACVAGILLLGINNKLVARMQRRIGPPVLQPLYDVLKCCGKETIVPSGANRILYCGAPFVGLISVLSITAFLPVLADAPFGMESDLVVILYLLTLVGVMMIIGGSVSGSPFAGVGLSREMVAMISYELPFVMIMLAVGRAAGADTPLGVTFSLQAITSWQEMHGAGIGHLSLLPAAIAMLFVIPCEVGMHPFDIAEAETEICEGILCEYTGAPLAMFKLTHCIKVYVMCALFKVMFLSGITTGNIVLDALILLLILTVLVFITMALPHAVCARFRVEQVMKFYWSAVSAAALVSLVLTFFGI